MKDLLIGIILGILIILMIQYFLEVKRIDIIKQDKQYIITVEAC